MINGIFITGTDTGVGKTWVAVRIGRELRKRGVGVGVMKPAETGCRSRNGKLYPADTMRLVKAAGIQDRLEDVNPYRFSKPLAPSVAAQFEGKRIRPEKLISAFHRLSEKYEFMIVEGAGGIMVPLCEQYLYIDLVGDLGLPVVIVARPGLGTINHALLTIEALKHRKLDIMGIIINHSRPGKTGLAEKTSPGVIEKTSGVEMLGILQYGSSEIKPIVDRIQRLSS
jgi:dethiobiotin synthetase